MHKHRPAGGDANLNKNMLKKRREIFLRKMAKLRHEAEPPG